MKSLALALMFGACAFASTLKLTGDHICHRQEKYKILSINYFLLLINHSFNVNPLATQKQ